MPATHAPRQTCQPPAHCTDGMNQACSLFIKPHGSMGIETTPPHSLSWHIACCAHWHSLCEGAELLACSQGGQGPVLVLARPAHHAEGGQVHQAVHAVQARVLSVQVVCRQDDLHLDLQCSNSHPNPASDCVLEAQCHLGDVFAGSLPGYHLGRQCRVPVEQQLQQRVSHLDRCGQSLQERQQSAPAVITEH